MKMVLLGGTKGMGRAVARILAERGDQIFLLGRDEDDLERSALDLESRGAGNRIEYGFCDLMQPKSFDLGLEQAYKALDGFDTVLISAGLHGTQEELEVESSRAARVLTANFTSTVLFCEAARKRLLEQGGGTLCVFSSVAGDRGRSKVALYGATKAGLSTYLEALDHRYRLEGLDTVCVKPGFVHTGMTAGMDPPPFAAHPEDIAPLVVKAIDRGTPVVYVPGIWRWVMLVIRMLPRFIMRRIGF